MVKRDELEVMASIRQGLEELPDDAARGRVVRWAAALVKVDLGVAAARRDDPLVRGLNGEGETLSALLDRATPAGRSDLILTVASWLEASGGGPEWTSQSLNDQLKQLGLGVPNITDALSSLIAKKPALIRQTRKSGRAQQARKRYALTTAGKSRVASLVGEKEQQS